MLTLILPIRPVVGLNEEEGSRWIDATLEEMEVNQPAMNRGASCAQGGHPGVNTVLPGEGAPDS